MKKIILILFSCLALFQTQIVFAEDTTGKLINAKLDQAENDLNADSNITNAWKPLIEVSEIINQHPEYDDGEYAEGINDVVTRILTKPWKYIRPYLTEEKGTALFRDFLVNHINDLSSQSDLHNIKKNISKNCNITKYQACKKLLDNINIILKE